jgi:predicted transcriptional regulator
MKIRKFEIGIKPLKERLHEFANVWDKLRHGEKVEERSGIYFESIDAMRKVLTNKRLTILKVIKEEEPNSVYALAKLLGRDLKNVNQDLKMLVDIGLVTVEPVKDNKKRIVPHVEYDKILLEIPV